jgi:uncharacterized protein
MANPFAYAELHTKDAGAAKEFYRKLFDWGTKDSLTPMGPYTMIDTKEGFPGGVCPDEKAPAAHWLVYVRVDDLASSVKKGQELGGRVLHEPISIPEGRFAVVADPTGAPIGLFEPVAKK